MYLPFLYLCPCLCLYLCPCRGLCLYLFLSHADPDGDPGDACYYGVYPVTGTVIVSVYGVVCLSFCSCDLRMRSSVIVSENDYRSCLVNGNDCHGATYHAWSQAPQTSQGVADPKQGPMGSYHLKRISEWKRIYCQVT